MYFRRKNPACYIQYTTYILVIIFQQHVAAMPMDNISFYAMPGQVFAIVKKKILEQPRLLQV